MKFLALVLAAMLLNIWNQLGAGYMGPGDKVFFLGMIAILGLALIVVCSVIAAEFESRHGWLRKARAA